MLSFHFKPVICGNQMSGGADSMCHQSAIFLGHHIQGPGLGYLDQVGAP